MGITPSLYLLSGQMVLHYGNYPKFIPVSRANGASLWELPQVYTCIQGKWCFTMGITPSLYLYLAANGASLWESPQVCTFFGGKWRFFMGITPSLYLYLAANGASLWELPQVYTCIWRQMSLHYGNYPKFVPASGGKWRFTMGITPSLYLYLAVSNASLWELPQV